jgi:hypothetical protein
VYHFFPEKAENNSENSEAQISLPRDRKRIKKRLLYTKKAENNSWDNSAQVASQRQKKDLGKSYYKQRRQRLTVRMLRPR